MSSNKTHSPNAKKELTQEERDRIMRLTPQLDARGQFECAVLLVATTELRPSEILALTWADIDWEGATANVSRANMHARGLVPCKVARTVAIPPDALEALRSLRAAQGERLSRHWKHLATVEDGAVVAAPKLPIVCNLKGHHVNPRELSSWWRERACDFDMSGWSLADLRRAHLLMVAIGVEAGR